MSKTALLLAVTMACCAAPARERRNFDQAWRFHKGDVSGGERAGLDDSGWRKLDLPHDWSIEGPYSPGNASGTGFLPGGIGWYRKSFPLEESLGGREIAVTFDGVYRDSDVWINGHHLGHRPSGYNSFEYDLTPYVNLGAKANLLAVRVDHSENADSRFYTGSGIYRHVWLTIARPVHVPLWGVYVYTPSDKLVSVETSVVNELKTATAVRLVTSIEDVAGRQVAAMETAERMAPGATHTFAQQGTVSGPRLWSTDEPNLYAAVTRVYADGSLVDDQRTPFGIRSIRFDADRGFFLNGKAIKLKGVCLHHDLGALGAAFSEAALERRLKTLKELGVNAIRCSHNPMAPEQYDLCDRLGLLVMDEAFDEWTGGKHKWIEGWNAGTPGTRGYHEVFEKWSIPDIEAMVLRDRNHPSVVLWSIGNEIDYAGDPFGPKPGMQPPYGLPGTARALIGAVKRLDGTRPVTQALADTVTSNATGLAGLLDVVGYNYLEQHYAEDHARYPGRIILGSENAHSLAAWHAVAANDYVAGQFLWTGVDYLGEANRYPSRGSAAGLLDACGFRKPESYLREALWSDRPMVYAAAVEGEGRDRRLGEHWNWSGGTIPVEVYTNCASAELFLNGRSLGERAVADRLEPVLHWEVPYEAGVLRVVGKRDGKEAASFQLATAGGAQRIELAADKTTLKAGGSDLADVEIRVVDAGGRRVYGADAAIEVRVDGAGELVALDTGDLADLTPVQGNRRKVFQGRALAIVRAGRTKGRITVRASAAGLKAGEAVVAVE